MADESKSSTSEKVTVICTTHGEYSITREHIKRGVGCKRCYFDRLKTKKDDFILRSKKHFGDRYDYSSVDALPTQVVKVKIKCLEHDELFFQNARSHMRGHTGCSKCKSSKLSGSSKSKGSFSSHKKLNNDFISSAIKVHGYKYNYKGFNYVTAHVNGEIVCKVHGKFYQTPSNHLRGSKCPDCAIERKKENTFKEDCKKKGINYQRALKRRQAGMSEEKIYSPDSVSGMRETKPIEVFGVKYPNLEEAVRILAPPVSTTTITRWLTAGMSPDEAFEREPNHGYDQGIIYLIKNILTGKNYVGLTVQTEERRLANHFETANNNINTSGSLQAAMSKYGKSSFQISTIDTGLMGGDLELKEKFWIKKLNTLKPNGYNILASGGGGGSIKKPITLLGTKFESRKAAAKWVSEAYDCSLSAAKKRIEVGNVDIKKRAVSC